MIKSITLMSDEERLEVLKRLKAYYPNPKGELNYTNPYDLLIAVMLSAQSTDARVNLVMPNLMKEAQTPQEMVNLGEDRIGQIIKSVGLWKNKSKNVVKMSQKLVDDFNSKVPSTYDELVALPGVGSKTAKVVLNLAFKQPYIAVDTHIFRILNRTGFCIGKNVQTVESNIVKLVPDEYKLDAHHYFLLTGRYICTARKVNCDKCPLDGICMKKIT